MTADPPAPPRRTLMCRPLTTPFPAYPVPAPYRTASVTAADASAMGDLSYAAYRGGVDDHGETPDQHRAELVAAVANEFGEVDWTATRAAWLGTRLVSLSLITEWRSRPLLAFALTHPGHASRGLARALITDSASVLQATGREELTLVVTRGNPAERLYTFLGFVPDHPPDGTHPR